MNIPDDMSVHDWLEYMRQAERIMLTSPMLDATAEEIALKLYERDNEKDQQGDT